MAKPRFPDIFLLNLRSDDPQGSP